ncbi:MBL fold metallo-hydrolase [Macrococcus equipercicus]|uniref:MBL fold metallo-hydrolase n=1 Tax=Macrococcus equipercicus TaxID=69967 RepID=A0A9Q9BNS5_9STAP|nr:MBL fold metallo-hydrolase [Macrococcus equipercicus]KAA1040107.1 MBL fold metallo-hydrolase [Macrococcus equipercicus]UTH12946.1 MBL fold metallo-hydrolase [Macrococcus equipercicus]
MKLHAMSLGMLETNCYIVENDEEVLVIDPGAEAEKIINQLVAVNKPVAGILLTHTHFDHIGAVDDLCRKFDVPVYVSDKEKYWLSNSAFNGSQKFSRYGIPEIVIRQEPKIIAKGQRHVKSFDFQVMETPGHSPGSLTYVFDDFAVVGDTLFNEGIGRTDLKDGNLQSLMHSITEVLFSLDEATVIYPGHGPKTTIGHEMDHNPYVNGY